MHSLVKSNKIFSFYQKKCHPQTVKIGQLIQTVKSITILAKVASISLIYYKTSNDKSTDKTGIRLDVELVDETDRVKAVAFNKTAKLFHAKLIEKKVKC